MSKNEEKRNNVFKTTTEPIKDLFNSIPDLLNEEKNKPQDERSRDFKALILTIIIISILVFAFWKVPFLRKLLFP